MAAGEMTLHGLPSPDTRGTIEILWQGMGVSVNTEDTPTSEGRGFRAMRLWTRQFYPGNSEFTAGSRGLHEGNAP